MKSETTYEVTVRVRSDCAENAVQRVIEVLNSGTPADSVLRYLDANCSAYVDETDEQGDDPNVPLVPRRKGVLTHELESR